MRELFKLGLVACDLVSERQAEKLGYPKDRVLSFPHRRAILIFRSEEDREAFLKVGVQWVKLKETGQTVLDYKQDVLGIYLGYPPKAVTAFMRNETDCTMYFGGTGFRAKYADLEDNLDYLRRNYGSTGFKCGVKLDSASKNESPIIYDVA